MNIIDMYKCQIYTNAMHIARLNNLLKECTSLTGAFRSLCLLSLLSYAKRKQSNFKINQQNTMRI